MIIYDVYISYSRKDTQFVERLSRELTLMGVRVFSDKEAIMAGQELAHIISSNIENSNLVLYIHSASTEQSHWSQSELKYAVSLNKKIVVIKLDDSHINTREVDLSSFLILDLLSFKDENITSVAKEIFFSLAQYPKSKQGVSSLSSKNNHSYSEQTYSPRVKWKRFIVGIFIVILSVGLIYVIGSVPYYYQDTNEIVDGATQGDADHGDKTISNRNKSTDSSVRSDYNFNYYWALFIIFLFLICAIICLRRNNKYYVKIHNRDVRKRLSLNVDGVFECDIPPLGVAIIKRKRGEYIFTFQSDEGEIINVQYQFNKQHNNMILPVDITSSSKTEFIMYRCFIGGSTAIVNERNAARSVLSILYNQYEKYNFYITAHTFEDFQNKHKIGGHQYEYDTFIRNKADCAIFIICKHVGQKTIDEYKIAIDTYESTTGERPSIFVYNDISDCSGHGSGKQDESIEKFRQLVDSKRAYWRDYKDIETLMLKIKEDISAELTVVLEMKPNLKRGLV